MTTAMDRKITNLVKRGYKQAAFTKYPNADKFAREWEKKGHKISYFKSSGPTVEHPKKRVMHAHYIIAHLKYHKGKHHSTVFNVSW